MYPDLFSIGPLTVHTYGLFVALGLTVALLVTVRTGKACGYTVPQVMDMGFIMILAAILGSRLMYVLINFSYFQNHPLDALKVWEGGLVFSGGLITTFLVTLWYVKTHGLSFWRVADLLAPGVAVGQAIGRVGCFMAGCCHGKPTDAMWGVTFRHPNSMAPLDISLHPTQIYDSLIGFIVFAILLFVQKKKRFNGQVSLWYLILHSTGRLLVERFRGDGRGLIPGTEMSVTQLITTLILFGAAITLIVVSSRTREGSSDS